MKTFRHILATAAAIAAFLIPAQMSASSMVKGEKTLGVTGGYATFNHSGYAGVYFQYTFVPHVRIAPEIGYIFRNDSKSGLAISCDMQFPFRLTRGFNIYPLAGLTFNSWNYVDDGTDNRFGGDLGVGFDLYFTGNFKLNLQAKYSLMKNTSGAFIGLGFGYVF